MKLQISEQGRQRFIKDYNLPIAIVRDPYFEYFISLYEKHLSTRTKYEKFCSLVDKHGEGNLFGEGKKVTDLIIKTISEQEAYKQFCNDKEFGNKFAIKSKTVPQSRIYSSPNADKFFISIDMSNANFTSLKYYDKKKIVLGCDTYHELLSKFTQNPYMYESKHIRQVIFGHLNPKRQQTIQKFLMQKVVTALVDSGFDFNSFVSASSDEVVLTSKEDLIENQMKTIKSVLATKLPDLVNVLKVEGFVLRKITSKTGKAVGFVKEFVGEKSKSVEFKAVPIHLYAQVVKKYFNQKIEKNDKMFIFEGMLCCIEEDLF